MRMPPTIVALAAVCQMLPAAPAADEKPARQVRFFPVGDDPPFRFEHRGSELIESDPPPGSTPPHMVVPGFADESAAAIQLRLRNPSVPFKVPGGEVPLVLRPVGDAEGAAPWLRRTLPDAGDALVFLWRNPSKAGWDEPLGLIVPDGPAGHPPGTMRITNLFPRSVRLTWGGETLLLRSGASLLRKVQPGSETPVGILAVDSTGRMKRYYSSGVTQNPGERGFIIVYRADGVDTSRPLKVLAFREPAPPAPPKPPEKKEP